MIYKQYKSYRYRQWNYSQQAVYFITICTKNRVRYFGNIENGKMKFTRIGFAANCFIEDIHSRNRNIDVIKWQVMPDHVHLLLRIKFPKNKHIILSSPLKKDSLNISNGIKQRNIHPLDPGSIPNVINHYKGRLSSWCRKHNYPEFQWQDRYHDRIIYNSENYDKAVEYIKNNPANWRV